MELGEIRNRRVKPQRPNVKTRPESIDDLERDMAFNRELLARATRIVSLKGHEGWEALVLSAKEKLEAINGELDNFHALSDKGRDKALADRVNTQELIDTVYTHEKIIEMISERLNEQVADLNERKQRLRTAQS